MRVAKDLARLMRERAEAVSAIVVELKDLQAAFAYALDVCDKKEACQLLVSGCEEKLSDKAEALCETKREKVVAAPNLSSDEYAAFSALCAERGVKCLRDGLRDHLAGIDIGLTHANLAIAETGTCVIDSSCEELRLSTMISEIHMIILPASRIKATAFEAERDINALINTDTPSYTAFVTGASRTADIERVLAIGVHGPLELHILMLEG